MSISKVNVSGADYQIVGSPRYATCSTAAATAAKVATIADGSSTFSLEKGARICVSFTYANTASAATLNVASTGAKAICWQGSALVSSQYWQAGAVVDFVYDGNGWSIVGIAKDNNSTNFLPLSGGSLTGNLTVGSSSIGTNGYIEGTWLKTTKATEKAGDFATIDGDGWVYKRAPANVLGDIGGQAKITAEGILKGDGNGGITAAVKGTDYDTEIVYVNYTGKIPTKDTITNMTEVVQAYNAGKVIAIKAVPNPETSLAGKVPFFLSEAINNNGAFYIFDFVSDKIIQMEEEETNNISCPYCIRIQCNQTQTNTGFEYAVSSVLVGLARAFPAIHADTHKIGGSDPIVPSDIGAQPKITANGVLKGDGAGNITAADETEVELVDLPQEIFWATYGETTTAEINAAVQSKKTVCCLYNKKLYYVAESFDSLVKFFSYAYTGGFAVYYLMVTSSGWTDFGLQQVTDHLVYLSLPTASWTGSDPYTQSVTISKATLYSKVDIQPSEEIYDQLIADGVGYLAIKNNNGHFTAVAKGAKPSVDLTVQVTYNGTSDVTPVP